MGLGCPGGLLGVVNCTLLSVFNQNFAFLGSVYFRKISSPVGMSTHFFMHHNVQNKIVIIIINHF